MKQTNSAIKFLLAQYRAIFKHAQLASILAVAAASALSIGQAQAAAGGATFGNDQLAAADADVTIDGTTTDSNPAPNTYGHLVLTGGASDKGNKVTVSIGSGGAGNTIKGTADNAEINLAASTLTLSGTTVADAKLTIGEKGAAAVPPGTPAVLAAATNVSMGALNVVKGTLDLIAEDTADSKNKTSVEATTITVGGGSKPAAKDAVVSVAKNASMTATTSLTVNSGASVAVSGGGSLSSAAVIMNDGEVKLGTDAEALAAQFGSASGTLDIKKGTIETVSGGVGTLQGSTITFGDGALVNSSGTMTIAGTSIQANSGSTITNKEALTFNGAFTAESGASVVNDVGAKTVTFSGNTEFKSGSTFTNSGNAILTGNTHTFSKDADLKIDKGSSLTLKSNAVAHMSLETLAKLASGSVQSSGGEAGTIELQYEGTDPLDLASGDTIFSGNGGTMNANLKGNTGKLYIKGSSAVFSGADSITGQADNAGVILSFSDLKLGTDQIAADFEAKGVALEISNNIAIAGDKGLALKSGSSLTLNGDGAKTLSTEGFILGETGNSSSSGSLTVSKGEWTAKNLTVTSGTASVSNGAKLTLTKGLTTTGPDGKLVVTGVGSTVDAVGVETLSLASGGLALENAGSLVLKGDKVVDTATGALKKGFEKGSVSGSTDTKLTLLSSGEETISMTVENYNKFRTAAGFKGIIDIKLSDTPKAEESMPLDGQGSVIAGVTNGYEKTQAQVSGDVTDNYYVGNVKVTNGTSVNLGADGALTLSNANANNSKGQYVTNKDGGVGTVTFKDSGNSLTLAGAGGKVGAITNSKDGEGTVNIGEGSAVEVVSGSIGTAVTGSPAQGSPGAMKNVNVLDGGSLTLESGSVFSNNLSLGTGSGLNVGTGEVVVKEHAAINGDVKARSLTLSGTVASGTNAGIHSIAGDANVDVDVLKLGEKNTLTIGDDGIEGKPGSSTTAQVFVDYLDLGKDSVVFVDPDWTEAASILATKNLGEDKNKPDTHVLSGDIFVGKNAAFGYGFDESSLKDVLAPYLIDSDKFSEKGVKNALVIGKNLEISSGKGINVNAALTDADANTGSTPDTLVLGAGSALVITDDAFGPNKDQAAITFGSGATSAVKAKVDAEAGSIVTLVGDITKQDTSLKLFAATTAGGTAGKVTIEKDLTVEAAGGLLSYKYAAASSGTDAIAWTFDPEAEKAIRSRVSAPTADMFVDFANGKFAGQSGDGYDFVSGNLAAKKYEVVDVAAHAATYAGAQQAAVAAVTTMAEAVGSRVSSMGVESSAITATGSQANGGVWLTPMYKSVDADGFGAQGVSYGADVDLAGVAFGADTVNGAMRFGAVFNIGSGDSDGKGMGSGLKDEFDYYGFGIYSVMGFGQLSLVGDASLNVISHEVEASGLGVKAKADTTAVTMGITGQYAISTSSVDVVPHLGARFIRLDTDSYDLVDASDAFASTDFEVQNVFSVPLGVSISKGIEMGGWSLAPSADFSITFNTGDVEVDSTTRFTGLNHNLGLSTEVLDEVTYGVAVGLGAQYGAFGTHIGLNYTGSENTDSFGVNAQARYMF